MIVLRGGTLVSKTGPVKADIAVDGKQIVEIAKNIDGPDVVDCSGQLIGPGFVDIHVHFRDPGQTWKEDIETGSESAAAGGFTAVVPMANTEPATDSPKLIKWARERSEEIGLVDLAPAAALTRGRLGTEVTEIEDLWKAGVRIFSDDGDSVADPALLEEAMIRIKRLGGLVAQHAEDASMTSGGHMHQGAVSSQLGIGGLPAEAEEKVVARDLDLVRRTGARYHVQHVSTAGTVALVRAAKAEGLPVTAEAAPHHFTLDHRAVLQRDTIMKMYPPLRADRDVTAVIEALRDGTIDAVATDHAPHTADEKQVTFEEAPRGIIGLETSSSLTWSVLSDDPVAFFDRMSVAPARLAGLDEHGQWLRVGGPANLVAFDPHAVWTADSFASRSRNSPWLGETLRGKSALTMLHGQITHRMRVLEPC